MPGGNPKGSSLNKPSSSSSSSHRKSRWESGNQPAAVQNPGGGGSGDANPSKPPPKDNPTPPASVTKRPFTNPKLQADPALPHSLPGAVPPAGGAPFPEAAGIGRRPAPTYGFHMLDRRTIALADRSVRTYLALPPDYRDFSPPPPRPPFDPAGRFLPLGYGVHGPEVGGPRGPAGWGSDKRFPPGEGFRERDDGFGRGRQQDYWNSLGLDGRGPGEGVQKRKFGEDEDDRVRGDEKSDAEDEYVRQRQQFLQHANAGANAGLMPNGLPYGVGERSDSFAGASTPYSRDAVEKSRFDEMRSSKFARVSGGFDNAGLKHLEVDQVALKTAFLHFAKLINENVSQRKVYQEDGKHGRLKCVACDRSSKDFPDMHSLIMHTYNSDNADLHVDHLGLHKALCVLMGWNFSKPPDNSKAYQFLHVDEAAANQDDLIMWPPLVIIHNTVTGKGKDGRMEGLGNKAMDNKLRDLGFETGKSKSLYSRDGHLGITIVKYSSDLPGLNEAKRLAEFFEKENRGRKDWAPVPSSSLGKDDDRNPNLVQVDVKTGERKRIFYGYLGTASDLDKIDIDTRKKVVIKSQRELHLFK